MTGTIYVITEDHYLHEGLKYYYPHVKLIRRMYEVDFNNVKGSIAILIDSRMPVYLLEHALFKKIGTDESFSIVILEMRTHVEGQGQGVMNWYMDMSLTHDQIGSMIELCLNFKNSGYFRSKLKDFKLNRYEIEFIRLLRDGRTMDFVARQHDISVKSAYRRRIELHERLGLSNFNEACIFIFKNNLLDQSM